jgi:lysozyme family protein
MQENFANSLREVTQYEGTAFSNRPDDRGGPTRYGVVQATYDTYRRAWGQPTQSVEYISWPEVSAIYKDGFWDACRCDDLPAGVDFAVFQAAVNIGTGTAARLLQGVLGVTQDGSIGSGTLGAVQGWKAQDLSQAFLSAVQDYYTRIAANHPNDPQYQDNVRGWLNRVDWAGGIASGLLGPVGAGIAFFSVAAIAFWLWRRKRK